MLRTPGNQVIFIFGSWAWMEEPGLHRGVVSGEIKAVEGWRGWKFVPGQSLTKQQSEVGDLGREVLNG